MRYQEYKPPPGLAPWVNLFWVYENRSNDPAPEVIVADGFPELIIHFGSPFSEIEHDGQLRQQPRAILCGQLTEPLTLHGSVDAGMIGIRLHPSGMAPFVSDSMRRFTDKRVSASDIFSDIDQLSEQIWKSCNDAQRVAACCRFLKCAIDIDGDNVGVRNALEKIQQTSGCISVESLANLMGMSRRSLELSFQNTVGTSPKMYCRITRFRRLYDAVSENGLSVNWVQTALRSGFFDQSHLIRDFRQFTGDSPSSFLAFQTSFAHLVNQV